MDCGCYCCLQSNQDSTTKPILKNDQQHEVVTTQPQPSSTSDNRSYGNNTQHKGSSNTQTVDTDWEPWDKDHDKSGQKQLKDPGPATTNTEGKTGKEVKKRPSEPKRRDQYKKLKTNLNKLENTRDCLSRFVVNNIEALENKLVRKTDGSPKTVSSVEIIGLYEKRKELEGERARLFSKLSQVAGERLRNDNPGITDLSDPNRPTKIGDKFSELYDNEWTEVMDVLFEKKTDNETIIIEFLLTTLLVCYEKCVEESQQQLQNISHLFLCYEAPATIEPKDIPKSCKEYQKSIAEETLLCLKKNRKPEVAKKYTHLQERASAEKGEHCYDSYFKKCLELCWYMRIQDPPVCIKWEAVDKPKEFFRSYTRSGSQLDFVVWPALLLYKDGPILHRGVAQFSPKADITKF